MTKQINPTGYRLGITQNWWISNILSDYSEYPYFISQDLLIRNIVSKVLLAAHVYISDIMIIRAKSHIELKFLYFSPEKNFNIRYHIYLLKFIFQRIFLIPVYFKVVKLPSMFLNANILSQYINNEIKLSPKKYKTILKKIIKQYDTIIK